MNELIAELKREGVLKNPNILRAFQGIDRKDFVPEALWDEAYGNYPLPLGNSGQTISQPYTVAFMLDLLSPETGEKILDVGSGSGWTTALLASVVGLTGKVYGVEIIPELVALGQKNLAKYDFRNASIRQAGEKLGIPEEAPFDKILVSAAGSSLSHELLSQLKTGGILVMPIENYISRVKKISADKIETEKFEGFAFVPLVKN